MSKLIRTAVIGLGFAGRQHLDALRRIPNIVIVAASDPNVVDSDENRKKFGVNRIYTDYEEMLDTEKLDAVHNCTPNALHSDINRTIIERGMHVYCEKPLSLNAKEALELYQLAEEHKVFNGVNFNYRNNAAVREMGSRVASGDSGKVYLVYGQYIQDWLMYETDYSWRLDVEQNGKSRAVADIGVHIFDTAQIASNKKIVSVYANLYTAINTRKQPKYQMETFARNASTELKDLDVTTEDIALIMCKYEDGTPGIFVVSQVSGGHKNDLILNVDCENYGMKWEQEIPNRLWVGSRKEGTKVIEVSPATVQEDVIPYVNLPEGHVSGWCDALKNSISLFYEAIEAGDFNSKKDYATFYDGWRAMMFVEACMKSNNTNQWININI